ncbi:hypothetical protein FXO38_01841 [Capsicum annuum]|nr:hypothetical protein FXO37_08083 [Capsicum annuum]KAF3681275.1 hypothetical protein FXO38_01841 [Capsicum annuum]
MVCTCVEAMLEFVLEEKFTARCKDRRSKRLDVVGGCGSCVALVSKYDPNLKKVEDFSVASFHASQCGFCTPGMCMSFFSALVNADKGNKSDPQPGFSKLTSSEAKKAIAGNLCRCTGYRSIADACKYFAADIDIEDLGFNSFLDKGRFQ